MKILEKIKALITKPIRPCVNLDLRLKQEMILRQKR
jgi:hypothetical protein